MFAGEKKNEASVRWQNLSFGKLPARLFLTRPSRKYCRRVLRCKLAGCFVLHISRGCDTAYRCSACRRTLRRRYNRLLLLLLEAVMTILSAVVLTAMMMMLMRLNPEVWCGSNSPNHCFFYCINKCITILYIAQRVVFDTIIYWYCMLILVIFVIVFLFILKSFVILSLFYTISIIFFLF